MSISAVIAFFGIIILFTAIALGLYFGFRTIKLI